MKLQDYTMFFFFFYVVKANDEKPRFVAEAESKVNCKIRHKTISNLGDEVDKIDLSWEPSTMLTNLVEITEDVVGVEMQSGGGQFKQIDAEPTKKSGKWNYIIGRVPCESQVIRFFAENAAGRSYSPFTKKINASTTEEIKEAGYKPSPPRSVSGRMRKDKVSVRWERSRCAADYDVEFICVRPELEDKRRIEHIVEPSYQLQLMAGQKCTKWEVAVTAFLGSKNSKAARIHVSYSDENHDEDGDETRLMSMATKVKLEPESS